MLESLQGSLSVRARAWSLARRLSWTSDEACGSFDYAWAQLSMSCWVSPYVSIQNMPVVHGVNVYSVTGVESHVFCIARHLAGTNVYPVRGILQGLHCKAARVFTHNAYG